MVLVPDAIFGAASIFDNRQPLFHQGTCSPQLLRGQMRATRPRFPLPLEFFQRQAALLV